MENFNQWGAWVQLGLSMYDYLGNGYADYLQQEKS